MTHKDPASPLRLLDHSCRSGLGPGNLGVLLARAGVGKTTLLVGLGIETALADQGVLHVALDQTLEHTVVQYEALLEDLAHRIDSEDPYAARALLGRQRVIQALGDRKLTSERLRKIIDLYAESLDFKPAAILIDGYDWEVEADHQERLAGYKRVAAELSAELWMTARTHREQTAQHPTSVPLPCAGFADLIDLALFLEPAGHYVRLRFLKDHDAGTVPEDGIELDPDTMRAALDVPGESRLPRAFTLLSGGHAGAEAAFGEEAEKWGVRERNFSFAGREPVRRVSVVELGDQALREGEVSAKYLEATLHRTFPETDEWRRLLDTIWHQVATAGQVFIVGQVQENGTVRGGTGWAAELAKHFRKPLFVFDQGDESWHIWAEDRWAGTDPPTVEARRFCGTGTRSLSDSGREAITDLFCRSFSDG